MDSSSDSEMSLSPPDRGEFNLKFPGGFSPDINHTNAELNVPVEIFKSGLSDSEENILLSMGLDDIQYLAENSASHVLSKIDVSEMQMSLQNAVFEELPPPEMPCVPKTSGRFHKASTEELENMFQERQSKNTKRNTTWGMKVFQDWNMEVRGHPMDLATVNVDTLAEALLQFYAETRLKESEDKQYHKNTLINIRGAINRHLTDIHRNIDIIRDKQFKHANGVLDRLLKQRARCGTPQTYKP